MFAADEFRKLVEESADVFKEAINTHVEKRVPAELIERLENDVYLFSGFKTYAELKEISLMLRDENGDLISYDKFEQRVLEIHETYNVHYLKTEYNFAIGNALMAARWADFVKDGDRYPLQYRTAGDARVRDTHRPLDGITLPLSDKFWQYFWPLIGWGCRCTVVQVVKGKYPDSDPEKAYELGLAATEGPAEIFRYNPGIHGRIFPAKHGYNSLACVDCADGSKAGTDEMCAWCAVIRSTM